MELLNKYKNGNVTVSIYDDGTKIQEWDDAEKPNPIFPNSIDIKITNDCDLQCKFCHEMSIPGGKHADIIKLLELLKTLPAGTELAIGGGNPLSHPNLLYFLSICKRLGHICNMTVNYKHIEPYDNMIRHLIEDKLVYGLGISIDDNSDLSMLNDLIDTSNVVFHIIAGVNNISILDKIKGSSISKVLILGYKDVGRGIKYHSINVDKIKKEWFDQLPNYIGKVHISFDNLAIKQLNIRRFFSKEGWNEFYMGTDGQFTMYLDAVNENFAVSSTSKERFPINSSIEEIFSKVKTISGN